jgi:UDPglucose 6-dehydrogenase
MEKLFMNVSVIGLGKLGAPLAAVLASKGHEVIGVDLNPEYVRLLSLGMAPVEEPRLQELIEAGRGRLKATLDISTAVLGSDITFVIVPTPSDGRGAFSNKHVLAAIKDIGKALRTKNTYHVVNITSTVMPGSTGGEIREALEATSGLTVGKNVGLCYNPEFIALGSVVRDMLYPDMILIGESDSRAGDVLESIYRTTCENKPPVRRMNFVNAELTKLSVNTYITTKISYANMLAEICDHLPGADVDVVTGALAMDSRIGGKYLKGALGYGGPCFPRDNVALSHLARTIGARADVAEATDRLNGYQIDRLTATVRSFIAPNKKVAILGLSYKPDTGVIEQSQGVALAARLADEGYQVVVYDPLALPAALAVLGNKVSAAESADSCVSAADMVVITTPWGQFRELSALKLTRPNRRIPVLDCWRILPKDLLSANADVVYLGHGDRGALAIGHRLEGGRSAAAS